MRSIAANALTALIVLGVLAAGAVLYALRAVESPGPRAQETVFEVPRGASIRRVSEALEADGVIGSAALFRLAARYQGRESDLRFGEYRITARATPLEVLDLLTSGRTIQYPITVAEGLTAWEVVELLRASEVLTGEIAEVPAEGTLAPDTYLVQRGDDRAALIARMKTLQERRLAEAWAARRDGLRLESPQDLLILASVIEKETGVAGERGLVSAVFHNRLELGMRLQSDPTIIYGITEGKGPLGRGLRRSEIDRRTPWNTYTIDGLPATPIANPGAAALVAAALPDESDMLYFVADGTGGHAFARTLAEHNRNVAAWRRIEAERASQ
jgi:UPF0755 protein